MIQWRELNIKGLNEANTQAVEYRTYEGGMRNVKSARDADKGDIKIFFC